MTEWEILSGISASAWALMLLQQDPLFFRIPEHERKSCIVQGIQAGLDAAEKWNLQTMLHELQEKKIKVICHETEGPCGIHAEYRAAIHSGAKGEIHIYQKTLQKICDEAQRQGIEVDMQRLETLHIAHEFYHYLESENQADTSKTKRVVCFCICGIFKQKRCLKSLQEIAAHTFAQKICNERLHPLQWDWLLIKQQNEIQAKEFYTACLQANSLAKGVKQ